MARAPYECQKIRYMLASALEINNDSTACGEKTLDTS